MELFISFVTDCESRQLRGRILFGPWPGGHHGIRRDDYARRDRAFMIDGSTKEGLVYWPRTLAGAVIMNSNVWMDFTSWWALDMPRSSGIDIAYADVNINI